MEFILPFAQRSLPGLFGSFSRVDNFTEYLPGECSLQQLHYLGIACNVNPQNCGGKPLSTLAGGQHQPQAKPLLIIEHGPDAYERGPLINQIPAAARAITEGPW